MQRMILRTMTAMSVMCLCCLIPSQVLANTSGYGPELDPLIPEKSENISLTCPDPMTVSCDDNGILMTFAEFEANGGSVNLPNNCEVDTFYFVKDILLSQNGCFFVYMREYFISSTCGNTFTCNQIILLVDDDEPMITLTPSDTIVEVTASPCKIDTAGILPAVTTFDGCSMVTVTNDAPAEFVIGMNMVIYTATDQCGNQSQATFTVNVENNSPLMVECPPDIIDSTACDISDIPAYTSFGEFYSAGGSATRDCDSMGTTFILESYTDVQLAGSCPKTVNRTYVISDGKGNVDSCTQQIKIYDVAGPTFIVPPDYMNLECGTFGDFPDSGVTGTPDSIMDNCFSAGSLNVVFTDLPIVPDSCVGVYYFERVWSVLDLCGNETQDTQSIFVVDTTPPTAICKDTVTLYLDSLGQMVVVPDSLDNGSSDLCSDVTFISNIDTVFCNQVGITTMATLMVFDDCDNMASCNVVIEVLDTMSITLTPPDNDTISCIGDLDPAFADISEFIAAGGTGNDNCPGGATFSLIDSTMTGTCPTIITRTYVYTDFSMNSDTALHTIYVIDDEAPTMITCPMDITISELEICDTLLVFGLPTADDNCDSVIITNNYTNDTSSMAIFTGGVTEILFTLSDVCGNLDTCSMTVTVVADPKVTCPPLESINSADDLPSYADLGAFLNEGGSVNMYCAIEDSTFMYSNTFVLDADSCTATITETVSFSDTSGDPMVVTKNTTAMDTINPVIPQCNDQVTILNPITCEFDTTIIVPLITDNFGIDTIYYTIDAFIQDTAQVTLYAEDYCGNIDSCEFNLVVIDSTTPKIEIDDITIMCDSIGAVPVYTTIEEFLTDPSALVSDCRLDSSSFRLDTTYINPVGDSVRQYIVFDFSNQFGTTKQTITVMDNTNPEFTMCTSDITMNASRDTCGAMVTVPLPVYDDNCADTIMLYNNFNLTDNADGFYPVGLTTVLWIIKDGSGLKDTCSFTVTITDTTLPDVDCPPDTMIMCDIDNYPPFNIISDFIDGGGQASDNCALMGISSTTLLTSPNTYKRTYTVVDVNGLKDSCTQIIEIIDTIAPSFSFCAPLEVFNADTSSCDVFVTIAHPQVTDNCDSIVVTNSIDGKSVLSGIFSDTTTVSWYAQDGFGNRDTCTFDIIVRDATGPKVTDPTPVEIMCIEMLDSVDTLLSVMEIVTAGGSATDNCGIDSINLVSVEMNMANDSITRKYNIIDSTGNMSTITQLIVVNDTTPPIIEAPADVTIECTDDYTDLSITGTLDSTLYSDNCMDIDTMFYFDIVESAVCPLTKKVLRVWVLTDDSANESRDTQMISLIDTIAPDFDSMPASLSAIDCDDDFPPMEIITATDECTGTTVLMDTLPFIVNVCAGYDVTYRWIAVDSCANSDTITRTFLVNPDITAPVLVSSNDTMVFAAADTCGISVDSVPKPIFEEDCSMISYTPNYSGEIYPVGTTNVLWTAQNTCGLEDTVTQQIIVVDNIPPVVMCKNATVGITSDPQNFVPASSFIKSYTDNCNIDSMLVMRTSDACGTTDFNVFKESILICCADVGTTVNVMVKVVDASGNSNFCNATLEVEDNRPPVVSEPLPDITISCSFVFDTLQMDVFGTYTSDNSLRENIVIEDTFYTNQDSIAGLDGLVTDECMITITDSTVVNLDICNNGTITRIFTFTDGSGNSSTSQQTIEIQDVSPFNENGTDIIWPADYVWDQCGSPAPDTSVAGGVYFLNVDKCALVAPSFKDQLFNYPTTSCPFIKRKWQVIDWCQYDDSMTPNPGLWTYNQYIFVENTVPPTIISGCSDTLICAPFNECSATVSLGIEAEDDCAADSQFMFYSYTINVNSDSDTGNDISGQTSSFSHELENGIHEVTWTVQDRCGNDTTCTFTLTVKECKDPTAVCLSGLIIVLDQNGEAVLWASDVNQSSTDNCTDQNDLIFSFSPEVEDFGKEFDCEDVGIPQYVEMWVTDLEGNQSFCSTYVNIQDTGGHCTNIVGNGDQTSMQGKIATESNKAIPEAMVSIFGAEMDDEYMTENDGGYAFEGINVENDYQIKVDRDKDDIEGVSTIDLVMIQRHILGLDPLDSPYKLIAADINNNENITASDLVALRKLILGIDASFPDNESWRFVSMEKAMEDMNNPWPFSEDLIVGNVPLEEVEADFVGVKIGDVNNSVDNLLGQEGIEVRSDKSLGIITRDQRVHRDNEVLVDFISSTNVSLGALQMTIEWDKEAMSFVDIIPIGIHIEDEFVNKAHVTDGKITIAWSSVESKSIQEGMPIFQMVFEGNKTFNLSDNLRITSEITKALAYDKNDEEHNLELRFTEGKTEGFMLFQNKPNPFVSETIVEFVLPEEMDVTFKVFNSAGSLIYENTQLYTEGTNSFKLNEELNDNKGILFLKMETAEFSDVKRMIRID